MTLKSLRTLRQLGRCQNPALSSHASTDFFVCSREFCAVVPRMARPLPTVAPLQASAMYFSVFDSPLPSWVQNGMTFLPCQSCRSMNV